MIFLQKDPSAKLLKSYLPPFKGTWKTLPSYLLPDDALQDSLNVTLIDGKLRSRCGLQLFNRENLGDRVLGSFLTVDTNNSKFIIASTFNKVYLFIFGHWRDITGTTSLSTGSNQVRMSSLQLGTQVYILYVNGRDRIRQIPQNTYTLTTITPHAGSIPVLSDICTSFSRFVGITPPYTVSWCDAVNDSYLSFTNWPALNQAILADTEDSLVAIRPLGTLGLAVYKEGNIFVGFAQSGANSQAFRFEHRGEYEGPAGVNAIVNVNGTHCYMTATGRVGIFDGTQHAWIADGLWPFLRDDVDTLFADRIFGIYNYRTSEVTFWYPGKGAEGVLQKMLILCLPYPLAGVQDYSYFLGQSNFPCSNGLSVRLFEASTSPLVFGNTNQTFQVTKTSLTDNGFDFPCSFKHGLFRPQIDQPTSGQDIFLPIVEVHGTRGEAVRGLVDVSVLTSNLLENEGTESTPETIDLALNPVNEFLAYGPDVYGSFLGLSYKWNSGDFFEYKGADVYGRAVL